MNAITQDDWRRLFELLDVALDLPQDERETWLARLHAEAEPLLPSLRELLESRAHIETQGFLAQPAQAPLGADWQTRQGISAGVQVGPYRLVREIGAGGMASVWLAERADGLIKRPVALKLPHGGRFDRAFAERLARERDILASLDHPLIARLLDAGLIGDGQPYLALQYVDGVSIDAYCDTRTLGIRDRLTLFVQVARAVAYAHAHLVIHRDLKPSNVLVTRDGRVCLLDFGIAKLLAPDRGGDETELTQLGGRVMTPDYAAPEQITGAPLTTATDVYSLGVLLFGLLSGERPYTLKRGSRAELESAIADAQVSRPSAIATEENARKRGVPVARLRRQLSGDLDTIVLAALQKSPAQRYASAGAMADDIERHLNGEAVLARPQNRWYRAGKFIARHRVAASASVAVVIALTAGLGVALWQARLAREQAARAEEIKRAVLSIFRSANPLQGGGPELRATELLEQARERIEQELQGRDAMQAELLCTVAVSLSNLSALAPARAAYEAAMRHAAGVRNGFDECRTDFAVLLLNMDEMDSARRLMSEIEPALRAGAPSIALGKLLMTRSALGRVEGQTQAALADAEEGVSVTRAASGDMSRDYMNALMHLGRIQHFAGKLDAAVRTADEGIAKAPRVLGTDHPDLPLFRVLRASALSELGRHDEAAREFRASLPAIARSFGETSQEHVVDLHFFALVERNRGDLGHAIELSEQAVALAGKGGLAKDIVSALVSALSVSQLSARRIEAAQRTTREAETLARDVLAADHPRVIAARAARAYADGLNGNAARAREELRGLIEQYQAKETTIAVPLLYLGELTLLDGDAAQALRLLTRSAELIESGSSRLRASLPAARTSLALTLLALGKNDDAEPHLRFALAATDDGLLVPGPLRAEAQVGLARLLLARGESRAAVELAARADAFWREFDPANRWAGEAAYWYALALRADGAQTQAREPQQRAAHILAASRFSGDRLLAGLRSANSAR
jgi:serine/threonine-protein kinase